MTTRSSRTAWLQAGGRVVLVGGVAAGVVLGVGRLGAVDATSQTPESPSRVAASLTTSYCPGNPFAGGAKDTPQVDVKGAVNAHAAGPDVLEGVVTPPDEPGSITVEELTDTSPMTPPEKPRSGPMSESSDGLGARPVRVRGTQERAPGLLATEAFGASGEEVQGLAAVPCLTPTADAWLVAGGGEKGRQERLVLTNPGGNAVTAQLETVTTMGEADTVDRSVVVPAHGRSVVLLDAIGGTNDPQAVHVSTTGGLVVPTIVDTHLDGLTPAGVEMAGPTAAPAKRLVVPGNANGGKRGIVLAAPGDREAVVQIRTIGEGPARSAKVVTVAAGTVVDVELPPADGVHSWLVESDEPVVAAAHFTTTDSSGRSDMAWSVATPAFGGLGGAALPTFPSQEVRRFVEITGDEGPAEVDLLVQSKGEITTRRIKIGKGHSKAVSVGPASAVWVRPASGSVHAAVLLVGREGGSRAEATSIPILASRVAVRDVSVTQVR